MILISNSSLLLKQHLQSDIMINCEFLIANLFIISFVYNINNLFHFMNYFYYFTFNYRHYFYYFCLLNYIKINLIYFQVELN
jgi:hypothetical protein